MTGKRFILYEHKDNDYILDNPNVHLDFIEMLGDALTSEEIVDKLNELHEEVMDLRRENTKFKLIVSEIIEDMQKYVDDNQLVYINQSYVDWIKKEVDTTLYSQKRS